MKKIKKSVVKEEVRAVEISIDEFVELAAKSCIEMTNDIIGDDEDFAEFGVFLPLLCAKYTATICDKLFGDDENDESEEK